MARSFYEDDEYVMTKPGVNTEISPELEQKEQLHNATFVEGMTIRTNSALENPLSKARLFLYEKWSYYGAELNTQLSAAKNEINSLSKEIDQLIKEPVLPNLVYILTITLTGSIMVNKRSLPLRFLTPTIFGVSSYSYFMPKSYTEVKSRILDYESNNFSDAYKKQTEILNQASDLKNQLVTKTEEMDKQLADRIHETRVYIRDLLK